MWDDPNVLRHMLTRLKSPHDDERFDAILDLRLHNDARFLPIYLHLSLTDSSDDVRREATWNIAFLIRDGHISAAEAYPVLVSALDSADGIRRSRAVLVLSRIRRDETAVEAVMPKLLRGLEDADPAVRYQAAFYFYKYPDKGALRALNLLQSDPVPYVQGMAQQALEQFYLENPE